VKLHFVENAFFYLSVGWFGACVGASTPFSVAEASTGPARESSSQVELKGDPSKVPSELEGVGVRERLGSQLSLDSIQLIDSSTGQKRTLRSYFSSGKPVLLTLAYYECPMLCTLVLNGLNEGLKKMAWSLGKEFEVLTVSIEPNDTPDLAEAKKDVYLKEYLKEGKRDPDLSRAGWSFATAEESQVRKLADELGFLYKYDTVQKEYAHSAVTFVLTPGGVVSRNLYGITYEPKNLKLALLEASQGKVGNVFDRLLMFCYHYEPLARGYSLQAMKVMQLGAMGIIALLGGYLGVFWARQRKGRMK
jgi:protein SCO1/2